MKSNYIIHTLWIIVSILLLSCHSGSNNHGHDHETKNEHIHEEHNHGNITYTHFEQGYELFIESSHMIVRENANFIIHITNTNNYKPINNNNIKVTLNGEKQYVSDGHKRQQGIYTTRLKPKQTGLYSLEIGRAHV